MSPPAGSRAVARNRNGIPASGVPAAATNFRGGRYVFIIGIDPHKGSHTAVAIDGDGSLASCWCARIADNASDCCAGRRCSNRACGRSKARLVLVPCSPSSSCVRVRRCWMCRLRCRRGRGCWTPATRTRRGEVTQGSDALLETTRQRRGLPTTPNRRHPLTEKGVREDNQGRL